MTSLVILTNLIKLSSQEQVGSLFIISHLNDYFTGGLGEEAAERKDCQDIPQAIEGSIGQERRQTPDLATLQLYIKRSQFSGTSGQT